MEFIRLVRNPRWKGTLVNFVGRDVKLEREDLVEKVLIVLWEQVEKVLVLLFE